MDLRSKKHFLIISLETIAIVVLLILQICSSKEFGKLRNASIELHDLLLADRSVIDFAFDEVIGIMDPSEVEVLDDGSEVHYYFFAMNEYGQFKKVDSSYNMEELAVRILASSKESDIANGLPVFVSVVDERYDFQYDFLDGIVHSIHEGAEGNMLVHYGQVFREPMFFSNIFKRYGPLDSTENMEFGEIQKLYAEGKISEIEKIGIGELYTTPGGTVLIF